MELSSVLFLWAQEEPRVNRHPFVKTCELGV